MTAMITTERPIPLIKRVLDLIVAIGLLIGLSPLLGIICLCILFGMGAPVLFVQERPGYGGKPFRILKFRTMDEKLDSAGKPLPDGERLSKLGRVLRGTSLDELPEIINIIKGEMSLVGPRPLLMQYLKRYSPEQARRHEVIPGLTGWAQVNGRNAISWEDKFKLDVWYVDHWSFWLDIKILFLTIWKTLKREGINEPGQVSMGEFLGDSDENESSGLGN